MLEFTAITLAAFVVALNEVVKIIAVAITGDEEKIKRYIPIFSLVFGVILGIIGYFMPNVTMGNNIVEAIFFGLASGASATGYHQVFKQLKKSPTSNDEEESVTEEIEEDAIVDIDDIDDESPIECDDVSEEETETESEDS
jgi:hypothetical protein